MATLNDMFVKALALYDEISNTGAINPAKTADYKVRSPYIADMLQKELWDTSDYTKIHEFEYTTTDAWTKITLPSTLKSIKNIILDFEYDSYYNLSEYRLEKDGTAQYLYILFPYDATVRVQYKPYPTTIALITDVFELDDITLQGVAYGLCKWFAASEQNKYVEDLCDAKFKEIKASIFRQPMTFTNITDVY